MNVMFTMYCGLQQCIYLDFKKPSLLKNVYHHWRIQWVVITVTDNHNKYNNNENIWNVLLHLAMMRHRDTNRTNTIVKVAPTACFTQGVTTNLQSLKDVALVRQRGEAQRNKVYPGSHPLHAQGAVHREDKTSMKWFLQLHYILIKIFGEECATRGRHRVNDLVRTLLLCSLFLQK